MRFLSVNADCFLIELASLEETLALYNKLHTMQLNGIKDLVPAAKTILVFFSEIETTFKTLVTSIQTVKIGSGGERNVQELIIPIRFSLTFGNNSVGVIAAHLHYSWSAINPAAFSFASRALKSVTRVAVSSAMLSA